MSFRRFHTLFNHLNKSNKHKHTFNHHHQHHLLFTSSHFNFQSSHKPRHIFPKTPYSNQINHIYSQCFNILYNHVKRNYHHYHHYLHHHRHTHLYNTNNPYQLLFKRFASMDVSKDYYKILGVNKNATKKEIRSSYLKLAKQWHPDLHKGEKEKEKARNKFIEMQEAYEVLHDDGMRKKYDEMRRYGMSQEQYKYHEAYQRQTGKSPDYTNRSANPYENAWEEQFRRNMQSEWEKIRREQRDWASTRRAERHKYADQFPFGDPKQGFGHSPFGAAGGNGPFQGFSGFGQQYRGNTPPNPLEGFFRTMLYVFTFFMLFRIIGFMLFGPSEKRRRGGPNPYSSDPYSPAGRPSPFSGPNEYNKYNGGFPPPFSLKEKAYKNRRDRDEYDEDLHDRRNLKRKYNNNRSPRPKNSLSDNRGRKDGNEIIFSNPSGNPSGNPSDNPSGKQTNDMSSPNMLSPNQQRRRPRKKKSKYEKMLDEQRMMEELYIKARRKQMEEEEFHRQREMNKTFGRRPPPEPKEADKQDVNEAWERYLNSNDSNKVNWRDRGRRNT